MSRWDVYPRSDSPPEDAQQVTGAPDPDSPEKIRAHTFAKVDNTDPIPTTTDNTATKPKIYNVNIPSANTEESQSLSSNTKWIVLRVREIADLKIAFAAGESGTNFFTVPSGSSLTLDNMNLGSSTIYFQSQVSGINVEIVEGS